MSFLSSTPPHSPLSATPENTDQLLKAYLAEEQEWDNLGDVGLRACSSRSSLSSISSTEAPMWGISDRGSPNGVIAPNATVDGSRRVGAISSPSPHSYSSRGRDATVQRPEEPAMMDSRSPSRDTGSLSMYRLAPYSLPPADGTTCNHSAPNLLIGAQSEPHGRFFVRPFPKSSAGHRESTIYLMPYVRDLDDEHKRSHSLSSIPPARPPRINKGSFYLSTTNSPHPSSDAHSFARSPLPSFLSAPMTPPADLDPLPAPASPTMSSGSESEGVEFGKGAIPLEHKGRQLGRGRRKASELSPVEPKTLISLSRSSAPKAPISVPSASSLPLPSRRLHDGESRGRPRWPRERQRPTTAGDLQRVNSSSKKKTKGKGNITIPIPEYKKPSFTVPSLPSLSPRKKWAVGDRVSGLFSGRIFNRLEVKEIIDTSVKNYETSDPSKRYSRARNTVDPLTVALDTDSNSPPPLIVDKKLPPLPQSASPRTMPATSSRPSSQDSMAAEHGSPVRSPEPQKSDDSNNSIRLSFLMDSQSPAEEGDDLDVELPVIDITSDLAMAVAEEEAVLPLQSRIRRLYQNPSLPSIPELSPTLERDGRRFTLTSAPSISSTQPLSPETPKSHLSPVSAIGPGSSSPTASVPPPIPPKSPSRPSFISTKPPISPTSQPPPILPQSPTRRYIGPPLTPTTTTVGDSSIQSPGDLDRTAFQTATTGPTGDCLTDGHGITENNPDASTSDSIVDWFRTYNFDSVGAMVRPADSSTSNPPLDAWPPTAAAEEQELPLLESDAESNSNRTSSLLQQPLAAELDASECGERVKMGCNFNDGSLGDYLSWEVNLLQVVDDGGSDSL